MSEKVDECKAGVVKGFAVKWAVVFLIGFTLTACGHDASDAGFGSAEAPKTSNYFPSEVDDEVWIDLSQVDEPSLFNSRAIKDHKSRYRLSISGISCVEYVIRIDESHAGRLNGIVKHRNKCKRTGIVDEHAFFPSRIEFAKLEELIEAAGMFQHYPEFWVSSDEEDTICLDGNQLLFERRILQDYRISMANAQCTAPVELHQVAQQFVAMSGENDAGSLLQ